MCDTVGSEDEFHRLVGTKGKLVVVDFSGELSYVMLSVYVWGIRVGVRIR